MLLTKPLILSRVKLVQLEVKPVQLEVKLVKLQVKLVVLRPVAPAALGEVKLVVTLAVTVLVVNVLV